MMNRGTTMYGYTEFEIYFSDLTEDAQKRLMEAVGITEPSEMNWDIDMCPIGVYGLIRRTNYGRCKV